MNREISLFVNGQLHQVQIDPITPLIYVLRDDLGLKSPKLACGLEQCGACKVLVDGAALPTCCQLATAFEGKTITTLEGIGSAEALHPVQHAFLEEGAAQCGYCTAGFVMATVALLAQSSTPSDDQIHAALDRHLCRCGTYHRVLRAVRRAAGEAP